MKHWLLLLLLLVLLLTPVFLPVKHQVKLLQPVIQMEVSPLHTDKECFHYIMFSDSQNCFSGFGMICAVLVTILLSI